MKEDFNRTQNIYRTTSISLGGLCWLHKLTSVNSTFHIIILCFPLGLW